MLKVYLARQKMTKMGRKERSKRNSVILVYYMLAVHQYFENYARHDDGGHADRLIQNAIFGKMLTKLFDKVILQR